MTRIKEIIKSLIGHVLDAALEHAILQNEGPDKTEMVETEHPQAACDASETETELPQAACVVAFETETETVFLDTKTEDPQHIICFCL